VKGAGIEVADAVIPGGVQKVIPPGVLPRDLKKLNQAGKKVTNCAPMNDLQNATRRPWGAFLF